MACAVTSEFSVFTYSGKKRYFSCFPMSIALCNGASIRECKAYWHINFSLINGCKNNIRGHSFFWIGACEFNIIIVTKKVNKKVYKENNYFVILKSIGIIAIKSLEIRSYKANHLNLLIFQWTFLIPLIKCPLEYLRVWMTDLVSLLFIAMIPIDYKITNFSLHLLQWRTRGVSRFPQKSPFEIHIL